MAIASWQLVRVYGTWVDADGVRLGGTYTIKINSRLSNSAEDLILPAGVFKSGALSTGAGGPSLDVMTPSTDDVDIEQTGWTVEVKVTFTDTSRIPETYLIAVPYANRPVINGGNGLGVNLRTLPVVAEVAPAVAAYGVGIPGGLAKLSSDGQSVLDADGDPIGQLVFRVDDEPGYVNSNTTDNTTAIQSAYTKARAAQGAVYFSPNKTYVCGTLINPGGTTTQGYGATLKAKPGVAGFNMYQGTSASFFGLSIDLNKANTTDPGVDTSGCGIYLVNTGGWAAGAIIRDVTVTDGHRNGVRIDPGGTITAGASAAACPTLIDNLTSSGCKRAIWAQRCGEVEIRGGLLSNTGAEGIWAHLTNNLKISGVTILNPAGHGIYASSAQSPKISGNTVRTAGISGIVMGGGDPALSVTQDYQIIGNDASGCATHGIALDTTLTGSPGVAQVARGVIAANNCRDNTLHGIYIHNAQAVALSGNTCAGNGHSGIGCDGRNAVISGNSCRGNVYGISLFGNATYPNNGYHRIGMNDVTGNSSEAYHYDTGSVLTDVQYSSIASSSTLFRSVRKASNTTRNNTASATADPELTLADVIPGTYLIRAVIFYDATTTGRIRTGWTLPSGSTVDWTPDGLITSTTSSANAVNRPVLSVATAQQQGAAGIGTKVAALLQGSLVVTTSGAVSVAWAQGTAEVSDCVVYSGSSLSLTTI